MFTRSLHASSVATAGVLTVPRHGYFLDGVKYLEAQERKNVMPSLFDLVDEEMPAAS